MIMQKSAVAIADIKIAVRAQKTGKSQEFLKRALAPCDTIQIDLLAKAAANGMDAIRDYLLGTCLRRRSRGFGRITICI